MQQKYDKNLELKKHNSVHPSKNKKIKRDKQHDELPKTEKERT